MVKVPSIFHIGTWHPIMWPITLVLIIAIVAAIIWYRRYLASTPRQRIIGSVIGSVILIYSAGVLLTITQYELWKTNNLTILIERAEPNYIDKGSWSYYGSKLLYTKNGTTTTIPLSKVSTAKSNGANPAGLVYKEVWYEISYPGYNLSDKTEKLIIYE